MSKLSTLTPIAALLAVSFTSAAQASQNLFALQPAAGVVLAQAGGMEGKCGEGKCGGKAAPAADTKAGQEGKCGGKAGMEGKCGGKAGVNAADAATAGAGKAAKEGKCGEGKCGGMTPAAAPQK